MKVYNGIYEFRGVANAVVTIGTFDGVHNGHHHILKRLKETAQKVKGETVILTFSPHPRMVLFPDSQQLLLTTKEEKINLLEGCGIDHLIIHPFTREFSMLSSQDFIENVLVKSLGTKRLVIGYDHHFGKDREGSFENLKLNAPAFGFEVEEIPAWETDNSKVSSTRIRKALAEGQVEMASILLGYEYGISGTVVKGQQLGRQLGFPTANIICTDPNKLIPGNGVYAVKVIYKGNEMRGMMNIGVRPTVNGAGRTAEVNIFDFNSEIYGESIEVRFVKWVRGEKKFEGLQQLIEQLHRDKDVVQTVLSDLYYDKVVWFISSILLGICWSYFRTSCSSCCFTALRLAHIGHYDCVHRFANCDATSRESGEVGSAQRKTYFLPFRNLEVSQPAIP